MKRSIFFSVAVIVVAVLALTVPFLDQAFHIDDREFIEFARAQREEPLRFYLTNYDYASKNLETFRTTHPPLLSSYLALVMGLSGGESESTLHLSYVIFPLIAGISMYFLSRRFCKHPLLAVLLLITTAGFLVSSHSLMGDVPGTAMWLASAAVFIHGADRRDYRLLALASLLMSVAVMTAYQNLSLVPLLFFYLLVSRRLTRSNWFFLLAPLAVFAAFYLFVLKSSGSPPQLSYRIGLRVGWNEMPLKVRSMIVFLGGAALFPLAPLVPFARSAGKAIGALMVVTAVIAAGLNMGVEARYDPDHIMLFMAPMLAGGAAMLYGALGSAAGAIVAGARKKTSDTDALFLSAWVLGVTLYTLVFLPFMSVRHMLPMFPPLVLLFVRGTQEVVPRRERLRTAFLAAAVFLGLAVSVPVAIADYRLANSYRDMAASLSSEFEGSGRRVWFLGEFDFRYYMEKEGFMNLGEKAVAFPGDIVIRSELSGTAGTNVIVPPPPEQFSVILDRRTAEDGFPLRVRNPWAGAGFYNHIIGPIPFVASRERLDEFTIYELRW